MRANWISQVPDTFGEQRTLVILVNFQNNSTGAAFGSLSTYAPL